MPPLATKYRRFVYYPDPHGEHVNRATWKAGMEFAKDFKPHRRIMGGDVFDFESFRDGANAEERKTALESDVSAGLELIGDANPTDWILGNHDIRPWKIAKSSSVTAGERERAAQICQQMERIKSRLKCAMYNYRVTEYCPVGPRLKAIHGFAGGKFSAAAQAVAFGSVICGHTHRIDYHRAASLDVRECWVTGCMRHPLAPFNERNIATLAHAQGFAFGYYDDHGPGYSVYQARQQEDGRWVIDGKTY